MIPPITFAAGRRPPRRKKNNAPLFNNPPQPKVNPANNPNQPAGQNVSQTPVQTPPDQQPVTLPEKGLVSRFTALPCGMWNALGGAIHPVNARSIRQRHKRLERKIGQPAVTLPIAFATSSAGTWLSWRGYTNAQGQIVAAEKGIKAAKLAIGENKKSAESITVPAVKCLAPYNEGSFIELPTIFNKTGKPIGCLRDGKIVLTQITVPNSKKDQVHAVSPSNLGWLEQSLQAKGLAGSAANSSLATLAISTLALSLTALNVANRAVHRFHRKLDVIHKQKP